LNGRREKKKERGIRRPSGEERYLAHWREIISIERGSRSDYLVKLVEGMDTFRVWGGGRGGVEGSIWKFLEFWRYYFWVFGFV